MPSAPSPVHRAPSGTLKESWQNFAWLLSGRLFRAALSISVGAWTARHLGPADYGLLNSAQAGVMLLLAVTGLGLDSLVRQQLVRQPDEAGGILGTCLGLRLVAGLLGYGALLLATGTLDPATRSIWFILGAMLVTHVPLSVDFWFQAQLQMRYSAIAQNLVFGLSSALRIGVILAGAPLEWFAVLIVLDGPLTALLLFIQYWRRGGGKPAWRPAYARNWLAICWPLLLINLATTALIATNQLLLLWLGAAGEAGRFAAAERVMALALFVPIALVTSLTPGLIAARERSPDEGEAELRRALAQIALVGWLGSVVLLATATTIVGLLYGAAYAGADTTLRLLACTLLLNGLGAVRSEWWVADGLTPKLLLATLSGASLNLLLALWWIPLWGAAGAAAAVLAAAFITHVGTGLLWPETRAFTRWQLGALVGRGWRSAFGSAP